MCSHLRFCMKHYLLIALIFLAACSQVETVSNVAGQAVGQAESFYEDNKDTLQRGKDTLSQTEKEDLIVKIAELPTIDESITENNYGEFTENADQLSALLNQQGFSIQDIQGTQFSQVQDTIQPLVQSYNNVIITARDFERDNKAFYVAAGSFAVELTMAYYGTSLIAALNVIGVDCADCKADIVSNAQEFMVDNIES